MKITKYIDLLKKSEYNILVKGGGYDRVFKEKKYRNKS